MTQEQYAVQSLELHMFYGRLMMEHVMFLEIRLMPANSELSKMAGWLKEQFETLLQNAVMLGDGVISEEAVSSGEMVTAHTLASERLTHYFTGVDVNQGITAMQEKLSGTQTPKVTPELLSQVRKLNAVGESLIHSTIEFKYKVLAQLQACKIFVADYPLLIRNMLHEAIDYNSRFSALKNGREHYDEQDILLFWKQGMLEHVVSYRNMFDPTETEMIAISDGFMHRYTSLMRETSMMNDALTPHILTAVQKEAIDYRDFSEAVVKKIVACELQCAIFPQMADHWLREMNYFVRLLQKQADAAIRLLRQ